MPSGAWMKGVEAMKARLARIAENHRRAQAKALFQEGGLIMKESKRLCPVAPPPSGGVLRASGHVERPVWEGDKVFVNLVYGGEAQAYAIAVHEHLSEHSPPSWVKAEATGHGINWNADGTGPKFLEIPLMAWAEHARESIAARIRFNEEMTR